MILCSNACSVTKLEKWLGSAGVALETNTKRIGYLEDMDELFYMFLKHKTVSNKQI